MGKQSHRRSNKRAPRSDGADVLGALGGSGFREQQQQQQQRGGWGRLLTLDHQDKMIIACIFCLAVGKLLSAFFYPEDAAEEDDGGDGPGGLLDMFGLRL
jgi:hypothetical protein